ncbi:MAG: glycosyltransferase [Acidimicrobiales bacterium]
MAGTGHCVGDAELREAGVRILFTFVGGSGHYQPLVPIARAAVAAGHTVTFACRPSMAGLVLGDGFAACGSGPDVDELTAIAPLMAPDLEHEERVLRDGFARRTALERARAVFDLAIEMRPDAVVCDEVDFGAMIAAEQLGVPHATVSVLAAGSFARAEMLAEPLNDVRDQVGLGPDPDLEMLSRYLVLVPCPPSFRDPAFPLPATARAIRPGVLERPNRSGGPPAWLDRLDGRPVVYATLGTTFNMESGDLFPRVLAGLADHPVDVVATVGRQLDPAWLGAIPANVHVERFIPQDLVLPRADLVVSHAGSGIVIGALSFGLPSVLLPMGADQTHNADRCGQLGVAVVLDPVAAAPSTIGDVVESVLADPAYRRRAARFAHEAAQLPDSSIAVALLESLVG